MVALTGFEITILVFVIFLAVVVAALLLYLLRRLKTRRAKLLSELDQHPELIQDRAFNRLAMARREARLMSDRGVDVARAEELIAEGQGAFDTRHYDRAYEAAQSAHEALVNALQRGSRTTGTPLPSAMAAVNPVHPAGGPAPAAASTAQPELPPRPAIPKNQAESQFQIHLLTEELGGLPARRAKEPRTVEASQLLQQASEAFSKGAYTDAFRLALRGRRSLGSTLETLPLTGGGSATAAPNGAAAKADLAQTAETVAGGERCPECGYPTLEGDGFCRGCGRQMTPLQCPSCGAPRGANEPFCGQCGNRFP